MKSRLPTCLVPGLNQEGGSCNPAKGKKGPGLRLKRTEMFGGQKLKRENVLPRVKAAKLVMQARGVRR